MSYARAYSGKIAGLGDAAYDAAVQAYHENHDQWLQQKAAYDKAVQAYAAQSAGVASTNASANAAYQNDLAQWNIEANARSFAVAARQNQQLINVRARDAANAKARAAGVVTPAVYPGCVTQGQHDAWQATCNTLSVSVRGLGADPTGTPCALALLPVCLPDLPPVPALRPKPSPPSLLALNAKPPAPLRPEPLPPPAPTQTATPAPPVLNTSPQIIPSGAPSSAVAPSDPTKSGGLLSNGLLLVVLAAGGYAIYRTLKKPKASA